MSTDGHMLYNEYMSDEQQWDAVDTYFDERLAPEDEALRAALSASDKAGMPAIAVSASQGKLLRLLAASVGAERILEIGTLGGYSTIWLAGALPRNGLVLTLESEPRHADVARSNLEHAGLAANTEVVLGKALDTLPELAGRGPFDFAFIDADKATVPDYFGWAVELSRSGSMIVVDNVVRGGSVSDQTSTDPAVRGIQQLTERIRLDPRVEATTVQTVGTKGYDGFLLARLT